MNITLAAIMPSQRRLREPAAVLADDYLKRAGQYEPCTRETFASEAALLAAVAKRSARTPVALILLDSAGRALSSTDFAAYLGRLRDSGRQQVIAAIGPADGWSDSTRPHADLQLSLGAMTLPHTLAQAVLAEQIYRAFTILANHPYHGGH